MTTTAAAPIPAGRPKSGRVWKAKQTFRSSTQTRKGVSKHLSKTFEEKEILRRERQLTKEFENQLKEEKKNEKLKEKEEREERQKRRMANEYKNSSYQHINASKLKTMSKKQLRMVKKTAMNKNGQVELVSPWGNNK